MDEERQRAEVFDALGHPTRIIILKALDGEAKGFADLKKKVNIDSSGHLQHHLSKLEGLIKTDENGKYCLSDQGKDALVVVQTVENMPGGTKKKEKRVGILWVSTGIISGSLIAACTDMIKQNLWFTIYLSVILGWLWVLTAITATRIKPPETKK
jgi:DNA-binding HxlR family transcriptional regulator